MVKKPWVHNRACQGTAVLKSQAVQRAVNVEGCRQCRNSERKQIFTKGSSQMFSPGPSSDDCVLLWASLLCPRERKN